MSEQTKNNNNPEPEDRNPIEVSQDTEDANTAPETLFTPEDQETEQPPEVEESTAAMGGIRRMFSRSTPEEKQARALARARSKVEKHSETVDTMDHKDEVYEDAAHNYPFLQDLSPEERKLAVEKIEERGKQRPHKLSIFEKLKLARIDKKGQKADVKEIYAARMEMIHGDTGSTSKADLERYRAGGALRPAAETDLAPTGRVELVTDPLSSLAAEDHESGTLSLASALPGHVRDPLSSLSTEDHESGTFTVASELPEYERPGDVVYGSKLEELAEGVFNNKEGLEAQQEAGAETPSVKQGLINDAEKLANAVVRKGGAQNPESKSGLFKSLKNNMWRTLLGHKAKGLQKEGEVLPEKKGESKWSRRIRKSMVMLDFLTNSQPRSLFSTRQKMQEVDALAVDLGNKGLRSNKRKARKSEEAYKRTLEQPFLSRWREFRRNRAEKKRQEAQEFIDRNSGVHA